MKFLPFAVALMLSASPAAALDMTAPVRTLMEITRKNSEAGTEYFRYVFDEDLLSSIYSADFAHAYREAAKYPVYDPPEGETTGDPFGYDPIVGGQDSCPLDDLRIEDDGDGQVTALFDNRNCYEDSVEEPERVLIFHVVEEDGRAVIDDIYPVEDGQSGQSIKGELKAIAKQ